jgi:hypothetical protein
LQNRLRWEGGGWKRRGGGGHGLCLGGAIAGVGSRLGSEKSTRNFENRSIERRMETTWDAEMNCVMMSQEGKGQLEG